MEGVRPEHDLSDPAVADRLRELAKAAPAPDVPNIWQFGSPCTTFCDFQLLNHGTRSFSSPEGDGTRAEELLGNQFADLCAELCESLYTCGREFAFESSAPSGRYPKIWDLPSMRRMRQEYWGSGGPYGHVCLVPRGGGGHARAFPPETHMVACLPWPLPMGASVSFSDLSRHGYLARACRASVPGAPRTRVAQQYGVALCAAWGLVVRAAYEHWDWRSTLAGKNVLTAIDAFVAS